MIPRASLSNFRKTQATNNIAPREFIDRTYGRQAAKERKRGINFTYRNALLKRTMGLQSVFHGPLLYRLDLGLHPVPPGFVATFS